MILTETMTVSEMSKSPELIVSTGPDSRFFAGQFCVFAYTIAGNTTLVARYLCITSGKADSVWKFHSQL
jgi:hypothetical protein